MEHLKGETPKQKYDFLKDLLHKNRKKSYIYVITNETDRTFCVAYHYFEDAEKDVKNWEQSHPEKQFMIVELEIL